MLKTMYGHVEANCMHKNVENMQIAPPNKVHFLETSKILTFELKDKE